MCEEVSENEKCGCGGNSNQTTEIKRYLKRCNLLLWTCFALYIIMMAAKGMYTAEISYIIEFQVFGDIDKATASLATTYYFLTYAVMQLLLSLFFGKVNIKWYILITVGFSALATALVAFMTDIKAVWILFALNGIFQAGIWSGIIAVLAKYLPKTRLVFANTVLSCGFPFGNIISFAVCALFVAFSRWDLPFIVSGVAILAAIILFFCVITVLEKHRRKIGMETVENYCATFNEVREKEKKVRPNPHVTDRIVKYIRVETRKEKTFFYALMALIGFFSAFYYYGVMNWVPSLLKEQYHLPDSISILITTVFPLCMLVGPALAINFCERHNFFKIGILSMAVAAAIILVMAFAYKVNVIFAIAMLILGLILEKAFRPVFSSVLVLKMRERINVGGLTAFVNAVGSASAAVAPTVIGYTIDNSGWTLAYCICAAVALITVGLMFLWYGRIKAEMRRSENA